MALWRIIVTATIIISFTTAAPTIEFPLNSQVPLIARVSQPFSYTFPESTFSSTLAINYVLSSGPSWLSLDATTRTLLGTPSTTDVGTGEITGAAISITATDTSGSITMKSTLIVSRNPAPAVNIPLTTQLSSFGTFSAPSTLLYHPSTPFKFNFDPSTFSGSGLSYYAVTTENTPMPSWISFDGSLLSFNGQTPDYTSLIEPPQTFGVKLIASDVPGFAGSSISFGIEVGIHLFAFTTPTVALNTTTGNDVSFDGLSQNLWLDGLSAPVSEISSITAQTPDWLTFNNSTLQITGTVPTDAIPINITVVAKDVYGDVANATVVVTTTNSIFSMPIPNLNATIGQDFSYNMSTYLRNASDIELSLTSSPAESWLSVDSETFEFLGHVPATESPSSSLEITITAKSKTSDNPESQSFQLAVNSPVNSTPTIIASSTPPVRIATPSHTPISSPASIGQTGNRIGKKAVILAILIPICILITVLFTALLYYLYRRRHSYHSRPSSPSKSDISGPLEAQSPTSVNEIVLPPPVAKPEPLKLDTSFFTHGITTNEKCDVTTSFFDRSSIRRSQTVSAIRISQIFNARPEGRGNRVRSYSENAVRRDKGNRMFRAESSWQSTQGSAHQTRSSHTTSTQRLTRQYSNYSRKGHTRRSARVLSKNLVGQLRESHVAGIGGQSGSLIDGTSGNEGSILGLKGSDFSMTPLEGFSALSRVESVSIPVIKPPEIVYATDRISHPRACNTRRKSKFISTLDVRRRSGVGHGTHPGSVSTISLSSKRRSIGHGQEWMSGAVVSTLDHPNEQRQSIAQNSRTWLIVATNDLDDTNRNSNISALSEYSDIYPSPPHTTSYRPNPNVRMSIQAVTRSPTISASAQSQPRSRSFLLPTPPLTLKIPATRALFLDALALPLSSAAVPYSPTVPEEPAIIGSLENTILHGLREESEEGLNDSFGISYGLAREGTRQLRRFIRGQLGRSKIHSGVSTGSFDSRFESAADLEMGDSEDEGEYEDYLPEGEEDRSEGSWETHRSWRDSDGNVVEYEYDGNAEHALGLATTAKRARGKTNVLLGRSQSRGRGREQKEEVEVQFAGGVSIVKEIEKRPVSVDTKANKRGSKVKGKKVEMDYSAYV
ncbi:hypothetical protein G7Y89_g10074 [Cudoniella acicularis]|uniref:Dystroglycan-type cadherin-like domain-containing protein n=1 Tax=Cudoniella acicularis TaxID=354080 RepID=A0A8H4RF11_9HELO|nr:hypothetical protein G7Y89_g10074 [Cudoniella acicularis]